MIFSGNQDEDEVMSEINMTPLVDVMLVLLIVFMITVPVLTHSVKVNLPQAENTTNDPLPEIVTISVDAHGKLYWNDDPIGTNTLETRLASVVIKAIQPQINIQGDRKVNYEHVVKVMAIAQQTGIEKLGFVTEPGK